MIYINRLSCIFKTMLCAITGLCSGVMYGILWLIAICICIPLLLLLFIPFLIFEMFAGIYLLIKGLDHIDEDV